MEALGPQGLWRAGRLVGVMGGSARLAVLVALLAVAGSAAGHGVEVTLTFQQAPECPQGQISCIHASEPSNTTDHVEAPYAAFEVVGVHPVTITVDNPTDVEHNLTFEPGTAAGNYSYDDAIGAGETVQINFTAVEDVPPGRYAFFGGEPGHREAGEEGFLTIINGTQREPTNPGEGEEDSDTAQEIMGIPTPGAGLAALVLASAALAVARHRRHG